VQPVFIQQETGMVARFFRVSHNRAAAFKPTGAIVPAPHSTVVLCAENNEREVVTMNWGFTLVQYGRAPRPVARAR
jgi:hypothetical protein